MDKILVFEGWVGSDTHGNYVGNQHREAVYGES